MKKRVSLFVCALTAGLLLSSCMTDEMVQKRASDARIELINSTSFKVELVASDSLIDDNGCLVVNAKVLLSRTSGLRWVFCGDPSLTVYYRIDWLDNAGKVCASKVREMSARPGNILDVQCVANSEKYISYKLTVSLEKLEEAPAAAPAKKVVAKKAPAKKVVAKKAPAKKVVAKKAPAKKAVVKKAPAKKVVAKKAPAKKAVVKKAPAKKVVAKKAPAKKAAVKKAPATKSANVKLTEPFN